MSSVIYKKIGKHDLVGTVDKRFVELQTLRSPQVAVATTGRPFIPAAKHFIVSKWQLLAESSRQNPVIPTVLTSALPPNADIGLIGW